MKINFVKNISLSKLAGIKQFVTLEFAGSSSRFSVFSINYPVYKTLNQPENDTYTLEKTKLVKTNDIEELFDELKRFVGANALEGYYIISDVERYRIATIKAPIDTEDVSEWLKDNTTRFLPDGATSDQFFFSHEEITRDEDFITIQVDVARSESIVELTEGIKKAKLVPLAIFPFRQVLHLDKEDKELPMLVIELTENSFLYSYSDKKFNFTDGEIPIQTNPADFYETVENNIKKIGQDFNLLKSNSDRSQTACILIINHLQYEILKQVIERNLSVVIKPAAVKAEELPAFNSLTAVKKVVSSFSNNINLLESHEQIMQTEKVEKSLTTRITLSCGIFLLVLLAIVSMGEIFLSGNIKDSNDKLVDFEAKEKIISVRVDENNKLKNDLRALSDLRSRESVFPAILKTLSEIMSENCYLMNIKLNKTDGSVILTELEGAAKDQKYVTNLVGNLELNSSFSDISLLQSNIVSISKIKYNPGLSGNELVTFKLTAKYHAHQ